MRYKWLRGQGMIIAAPGKSPHRTGLAFDLSGAKLDTIDADVKQAAHDHPSEFFFKDTIVERKNNCLHVDVSK